MQNFNFDREVKVVIIIINYFDPVRDDRSDKQSLIKLGNEGKCFQWKESLFKDFCYERAWKNEGIRGGEARIQEILCVL